MMHHLQISPYMIWDFTSFIMETNVHEKEWAIGFHIGTIVMLVISKGVHTNSFWDKWWTLIASPKYLTYY
jgi:hypothetical protein